MSLSNTDGCDEEWLESMLSDGDWVYSSSSGVATAASRLLQAPLKMAL